MKALTIEELKALKVGDWVWIVDKETPLHTGYYQIHGFAKTHIHFNREACIWVAPKALYGKDWLVYKNKEFAESNGEWVELPCLRDKQPIQMVKGKFIKRKELNYMTKDGTICSEIYWESDFEQAENRLREFQKENK